MENLKSSLLIAVFTFLLAILVTLSSQSRVQYVTLPSALLILILIIITGVIADMVGVAATVAKKESFNARAAKKLFGAKQGLYLARHGDRVASFMCDIVGDICGTVSGAIGAVVVLKIINSWQIRTLPVNLIIIGLISALTVGGKAFFKSYGIRKANEIIFFVGKVIAGVLIIYRVLMGKFRGERYG